jgi:hemoglobin
MRETGIYSMLAELYQRLGASEIRHLFPKTEPELLEASKRSAAFFVEFLGGPPSYSTQYGAPKMRQRHLPFVIDDDARQIWLACFDAVLADAPDKHGFPRAHLPGFKKWLSEFSKWMVNTRTD